ncbi:HPr(Ser) kinase/phosphatase [Chrysiogenes arsenatis]|uniref:HPr(Ser) kinase/phosphatase n=1 Tax=Chrysiogenes arsenatis TaxID=309797 RepID=UPI0004026276|nr:HPr(Ser) kinase/phosphatase [Chrysiogenes arsenatis]
MIEQPLPLTFRDIYERFQSELALSILAGSGMKNPVTNGRIQKSGLALAGFMEFIHTDRVQIWGQTEVGYLHSLPIDRAEAQVENFLTHPFPGIILCHAQEIPTFLAELCQKHTVPLLYSAQPSGHIITTVSRYLEYELAPETIVHGGMMDVHGIGILITGESGIGKSECCLDLVSHGHRLVADDVVSVRNISDELVAFSTPELEHHMEVRGMGIIDIRDLFGAASVRRKKRVEVIIQLDSWTKEKSVGYERVDFQDRTIDILGVTLPFVTFPMRPGRNIAKIIEVLARNTILRNMGQRTHERLMGTLQHTMERHARNLSLKHEE